MFGFGGIFNRNNKNTGTPAHPTSDPNVINISDYIGSLDEKGDVYTTPISTFGLSRIPGDKVIRTDVLDKLVNNISASHKLFRDTIIGKCDGEFPVTNPIKDNIYYDTKSKKYYKCITAYTGVINTPDNKFEEMSLLNNKGIKSISLSGGVKGSGNINKDGTINIVTTINYKDITGTPTVMPNEHGLIVKLNGTAQEKYDGTKAVEFNITPSSIGAQVAGNYALADHNHDTEYISKSFYNTNTLTKRARVEGIEAANNVNLPDGYSVVHAELVPGYKEYWNILSFGADNVGGGKVQLAAPFTHKGSAAGGIDDSFLFMRVGDKTTWKSGWRKIYTDRDFSVNDFIRTNGGRIRSGVLHVEGADGGLRLNSNNDQAQYIAFYKQGTRKMIFGNGMSNQPNAMMLAGENGAYIDINGFKTINMNVGRLNLGRFLTAGVSGNPVAYLVPDENTTKTLKLHDFGRDPNCYFNVDLGSKGVIRNSAEPTRDGDLATKKYVDNKLGGATGFAPVDHKHKWGDITNKPASYPPSEHNHNTLYNTKTEITNLLKGYSLTTHNHDNAYAAKTHNHNDLYNTKTEITSMLGGKLGKTETAATAAKLATGRTISITGAVTGSVIFDGSANAAINTVLAGFDANKITSGVISVDRLPKTALSEFVPVANKEARLKLTKEQVQNGDTVKETDTKRMFLVIDDTKLNIEDGYQEYTTVVDWASITGKPSTFTPSTHTHTWGQITDRPTTMANPHGLTISLNGKAQTVYTGAAAVAFNITAASIGAQVAGNYANADHNHNDLYAIKTHTHDEYQLKGDYALSTHNHDTEYAAISHKHSEYQPAGNYALSNHDHNDTYAAISHTHNEYQAKGNYALTDHNHNGVYTTANHNHDGVYQPKGNYALVNHSHNEYYNKSESDDKYFGKMTAPVNKGFIDNANIRDGFYDVHDTLVAGMGAKYDVLSWGFSGRGCKAQLAVPYQLGSHNNSEIYVRVADGSSWKTEWRRIWNEGNLNPANFATINHTHNEYQPAGNYAEAGHTHNVIKDIGDANDVTMAYSKAGLNWGEFSWLAGWNGYELRAVNKGLFVSSSGGTISGALTVTGQILSNADVVAYSDARFKTNLRLISNPLSILDNINGYYYDMMGVENEHQVGVIAQELQKVLPEAVYEDGNGHLGVRYTNLIPVLVEAVKEERDKRLELEHRLAKIEKMLNIK